MRVDKSKGLVKPTLAGTIDELVPGTNEFIYYVKDPKDKTKQIPKYAKLHFPLLGSPKIDGIRCGVHAGAGALSRSHKPIPNNYIRETLSQSQFAGFDGELFIGDPTDPDAFNATVSGVMSADGEPDFTFYVFDDFTNLHWPFANRLEYLSHHRGLSIHKQPDSPLVLLHHSIIRNMEELLLIEDLYANQGYEGTMLRSCASPYKQGRSTEKEGYLLKLKRFTDSEARIVGFVEKMRNDNEPYIDELGHQKRSSAKEGKVPANTLGALQVEDIHHGWQFELGTGFSAELAKEIWDNQAKYLGQLVKYKFQRHGMKDVPRIPSFIAFYQPL